MFIVKCLTYNIFFDLLVTEEDSRCQQACSGGCVFSLRHLGRGGLYRTSTISRLYTGNPGLRIWKIPGDFIYLYITGKNEVFLILV